jgi:hypothetical protein
MIFQSEGEVVIHRSKGEVAAKMGLSINQGDVLDLKKGWISLLNNQLKRVTLDEPVKLSYDQLAVRFSKASASVENKYLVFLWERMNTVETHTTKKGGVIRGSSGLVYPPDSSIILKDSICFRFTNPKNATVRWFLRDSLRSRIREETATDGKVCIDLLIPRLEPGRYFWSVQLPGLPECEPQSVEIPAAVDKLKIAGEIKSIGKKLGDFPPAEQDRIIGEICRLNCWIIQEKDD